MSKKSQLTSFVAFGPTRVARAGKVKPTATPKAKTQTINLRVSPEQQALIDRAAGVTKQSRTEFLLQSAWERAEHVLLDQTLFVLNAADWRAFMNVLDTPPPANAELKKLLARAPLWTRE